MSARRGASVLDSEGQKLNQRPSGSLLSAGRCPRASNPQTRTSGPYGRRGDNAPTGAARMTGWSSTTAPDPAGHPRPENHAGAIVGATDQAGKPGRFPTQSASRLYDVAEVRQADVGFAGVTAVPSGTTRWRPRPPTRRRPERWFSIHRPRSAFPIHRPRSSFPIHANVTAAVAMV